MNTIQQHLHGRKTRHPEHGLLKLHKLLTRPRLQTGRLTYQAAKMIHTPVTVFD